MSRRSRTHLFRRVRGYRPSEREHEGPSWRCAGGRSAAAGPCCRERVMSQMTQTLTSTPPTDDLVVPFHGDRWGALAKEPVVLASGSDLVFCGHHAREYESKLRDIAVDIIDTEGEQRVTA